MTHTPDPSTDRSPTTDDDRRVLVTGGAGFIGSHLVRRLLHAGHAVTVVDDFSTGRNAWVPAEVACIEADLTTPGSAASVVTDEYDIVMHLASRAAVNDPDPRSQFRENVEMTYGIVEAVVDAGVPELLFTSTSAVYGEAPLPTPEDYAPLEPISPYGASKLACEGILSTAAHSTAVTVYNLRFANIVGSRLRGAVIPDFIEKLRTDADELSILGDGRQAKAYMHVRDCIDALLHVWEHATGPVATYNLGTRTTTSVTVIADIVTEAMGLDPVYTYTGGDRGWRGDVPKMCLSIDKLASLGWEPSMGSDRAVRTATRDLLEEMA